MASYKSQFFDYNTAISKRSAESIVPMIVELLDEFLTVESVADFGCARGVWLSVWKRHGIDDVIGIDGDYIDRRSLLIETAEFVAGNLSRPIDLGRRFSLVQSLEVAEHLPESAAATFVDNLVRHSPVVLFSAAPPGQGGQNHINEKPYDYWRELFAARGFAVFDCVRPRISEKTSIQPWYRYNTILYFHKTLAGQLPDEVRRLRIPDGAAIPNISPPLYKLRKLMIRGLPFVAREQLAILIRRYPRVFGRRD